ncbi:hypothetical protein D9M70_475420 [compost metagenome]
MANSGYLRADLATLGGSGLQFSGDPLEVFTRQPMKHRQVSPKEVSFRRKVRLSKAIERFKVCLRDPGGEDKRFAGLQAKVLSMLGGQRALRGQMCKPGYGRGCSSRDAG